MQPFSPTAIIVLLTVIVGFALVLIVQMMSRRPPRPRQPHAAPQARLPQPTLQVQPGADDVQTAPTASLLDAPVRSAPLIKPVSPLVSIGKSILITAGFVAMAFLIFIALPQSWFEGILKRIPGKHFVTLTSGETLWLEGLTEEKSAEQLRVTGKVRNVSTREIRSPQVLIKVFGFDNAVMGTVAAPLHQYYLPAQGESEFLVSYQVDASRILRYTVIFQEPDGTALPHKDVRGKP
jgi:hypothetical protein